VEKIKLKGGMSRKVDRNKPLDTIVVVKEGGVRSHVSKSAAGAAKATVDPNNPWVKNRVRTQSEILTEEAKARAEELAKTLRSW
jgi:hypothetical protein